MPTSKERVVKEELLVTGRNLEQKYNELANKGKTFIWKAKLELNANIDFGRFQTAVKRSSRGVVKLEVERGEGIREAFFLPGEVNHYPISFKGIPYGFLFAAFLYVPIIHFALRDKDFGAFKKFGTDQLRQEVEKLLRDICDGTQGKCIQAYVFVSPFCPFCFSMGILLSELSVLFGDFFHTHILVSSVAKEEKEALAGGHIEVVPTTYLMKAGTKGESKRVRIRGALSAPAFIKYLESLK